MLENRELELQLREMARRLDRAERKIELLENPPPGMWLTPSEVEKYSGRKYTAEEVKRAVAIARKRPADSPLQLGVHYKLDIGEGRTYPRVNYLEFDLAMMELMRSA